MNRCRMLSAMICWSIVVVKYDGRSRPVYGWRRWT
jgi:hypothetical protein